MWKIRFFGIDDKCYNFLKQINGDIFSRQDIFCDSLSFVEYHLYLSAYNDVEPTKILEIAEKELLVYESLLKINGFSPNVRVDHPSKIKEDGTETVYMYFTDELRVTDSVFIDSEHVSSFQCQSSEDCRIIIDIVSSDSLKKELLILLGLEVNWINTYKIYEILSKNYTKERELKKFTELKYFAHSANSPDAIGIDEARHAVQSGQSPKKIANLKSAHTVLTRLSLQFIKSDK